MKRKITILGALFVIAQSIMAGSIGVGYGVTTPIYHNDKNDYILPIVDVEYDKFFIKGGSTYGLSLGYRILEEDNYVLSLYGMPFGGYEVKNSDMKYGYKGIEDRDTHLMGGIELTYYPNIYNLQTKVAAEYGEEGGHFNFSISRPYHITSNLTVVPAINYVFYDSNFVDYYFGVNPNEVGKPGGEKIINTFNGKSAHRIGVGILGNYRVNDNISIMGFTGVTKLSGEISNSPIVENDVIYILGTGLIYTF
ncbi:MipA/OmpV family protein [Fusobacterium mortiferum]|uniref:MipA/OmpV family protein n=1 Tax=Fusobacterium mortiferum TaxID=850 RepID=A0ABS2G0A0_FUSMR|nr:MULTISPECIES: MipA/OmpV family protein [Fusobacterium]MBM6689714.1 MipA/OmpV family protein [Fusobacterium mortiferum]MBM6821274.1 MipA/OmpV family protein [Fusobacterium mortiferum]MBM6874077.1 MipA/OmpV family protein [Fusobacterium mortiferum]MDO5787865.1 MipA/OmpV family protein [Fusobacterium sp.]